MESGGRLFFDPPVSRGNISYLRQGDHVFRGPSSFTIAEEATKKRPFFSLSDELFEEEYYDEQLQEKKRRLTPEQVHLLEKSFEEENKLEPERKSQLANKLGLQPRQVAVWFQNRRARWKTKQLEKDYDDLKASLDSLRANYDSVVKENEKLKSEVVSLTEKLRTKEVKTEAVTEQPVVVPGSGCVNVDMISVKVEDRLSSGSTGSAVVDDVDSGDSYFPNEIYPHHEYVLVANDDGGSYFSAVFPAAAFAEERHEEGEPLGWWVWS